MGAAYGLGVSGQGSIAIGTAVPVLYVTSFVVTTADLAHYVGVTPNRKIYNQGMMGLGYVAGSGSHSGSFWNTWLEYFTMESFIWNLPSPPPLADYLWYDIAVGGVMDIEVYW